MTLQALRCFAAVAKYLSYAEASKQLYVSQPAVSHQIKQLETELGVRLFDRTQRTVRLTSAGALFYTQVPDILNRLDLAVEHVQRNPRFTDTLTIGCESTIRLELLPRIYQEFQRVCPSVCINTVETSGIDQRRQPLSDRLDVVFSSEYATACPPGIRYVPLLQGSFRCVLPVWHRLAKREELSAQDLLGETLIFLEPSHCPPTMERVQDDLRRECRDINTYLSSSAIYTGAMIQGGLGIAVMPSFVCPEDPQLSAIPFRTKAAVEYGIAWHSYDTSEKVRQFVRIARQLYDKEGGFS